MMVSVMVAILLSSNGGVDDMRGESVLLKGLSQVKELELSVDS